MAEKGGGVLASNIGFMLSFQDGASGAISKVTNRYERMDKAMMKAMNTATKTSRFDRGTNRMARGLNKLAASGVNAAGSMGLIKGIGSKDMGNVNINMRTNIPRMAEGGIAMKESIVRVAEKGAEAIIPLSKLGDTVKGGASKVGNFFSDKSTKLMNKMFGSFKKVKKEWDGSFGKKSKSTWETIKKSTKETAKNFTGLFNDVKDISVMTALSGINDAFREMRSVGGADQGVDSFRESTEELIKVRGLSHKQVLEERNVLRGAFQGLSGDVNILTDSYVDLTKKGFDLTEQTATLAGGLGLLREMTGEDLTDSATNLVRGLKLTGDQVIDLYSSMQEVSKDSRFKTTFTDINSVLSGVLPQLSQLSNVLTGVEKVNVTKSLSALVGGLQSAGVEAGAVSSVTDMLMSALTDPELMKGFKRMNINPLDALKRGKPEEIVSIIGRISDGMKAGTFLSGKMAEKYSEKFGVATDVMFQLSGKTNEAVSGISDFYKASLTAGKTTAQLSEELKNQRTWWGNITMGIKNYVSTSPLLGTVADNLEGMGPALQAAFAGFMLLKSVGGGIASTFGFFTDPKKGFKGITKGISGMTKALQQLTIVKKASALATGVLTAAQRALSFAFLTSPIGWIVLGIGALVAAFVLVYKKSETFRNMVDGLWEGIKNLAGSIWNFLLPAFRVVGKIISIYLTPFRLLWEGIKGLFGLLGKTPVGGFFEWLLTGLQKIMKPLTGFWNIIKRIWGEVFGKNPGTGSTTPVKSTRPVVKGGTQGAVPVVVAKTEAGKDMKVTLDQSEVVGALNKMTIILTDIRDQKPSKGQRRVKNYRGEISPNKLAMNGTM